MILIVIVIQISVPVRSSHRTMTFERRRKPAPFLFNTIRYSSTLMSVQISTLSEKLLAKPYFLASVVAALLATGLQCAALSEHSKSMSLRASLVHADEITKAEAAASAREHVLLGGWLMIGGHGVATASVACLIVSKRRREPARRIVAIGALILYVISLLILV